MDTDHKVVTGLVVAGAVAAFGTAFLLERAFKAAAAPEGFRAFLDVDKLRDESIETFADPARPSKMGRFVIKLSDGRSERVHTNRPDYEFRTADKFRGEGVRAVSMEDAEECTLLDENENEGGALGARDWVQNAYRRYSAERSEASVEDLQKAVASLLFHTRMSRCSTPGKYTVVQRAPGNW